MVFFVVVFLAAVFFAAAFFVVVFLALDDFLAAVFFAAVFLAGFSSSSSSRSSKISEPVSPRPFLAASTERCSAASRSTTSPEVLVDVGVRLISPPSILVFTRVSTASA